MTLSISVTAMAPLTSTIVSGQGGTPPYTYSIVAGGAGGSLSAQPGGESRFTAPAALNPDPKMQATTIKVVDSLGEEATATVKICDALLLVCDILQRELGLANGRVYLYNQKIMQPTDAGLYVAVGVLNCKPFGNTNKPASSDAGMDSLQSVNMVATLALDIISRDTSALLRKEEVIMALNSTYAQLQQERNSFFIGQLPPGTQFVNLSEVDGAAIPYRFNISVNIQYFARKVQAIEYFDEFSAVQVTTES